ncbi:serine hydrolase domain-containing protein [Undibacterium pigrum]|uniref:CubicO group peptidase (Beta-lactamase class C family) n=1 Tax=Undibacterium pigrum TaxID=401470 RepID=A0A318J7D5_9BURK|nr:serine hydrolase domain-containing protein [Undibacterium pigrum]PXX39808.1 CubicO group peptidase (beta-lactamase class C family) [Undibacterium pigrum]
MWRNALISCTILPLLLAANITVFAQPVVIKRLDGSSISSQTIEEKISDMMATSCVTGLNIAILNDNKIVYTKSFGLRDKEKQLPLTTDSIMYGASFTKAVFATLVAQLVVEGTLDLDAPIQKYLPKPLPDYDNYRDLADDPRYLTITLRMLLNHTAGFANFRWLNHGKKLEIKFTPGSRYAYSGEGINLAQFIVETVTQKNVGTLIQDRIFNPLAMHNTSMQWQDRFNDKLAVGHDEKEKPLGHVKRKKINAAGSMDTSLNDYAHFMEGVMQASILSKEAKAIMLAPQIAITTPSQFPTLSTASTDENKNIQLAYGLGWGIFQTPYGKAYFKEGHDDGWENHSVVFDEQKTGVVIMSNSANGDGIFKELLALLIRDVYTPWKWEGYLPTRCR